jgi:hypothetical protein
MLAMLWIAILGGLLVMMGQQDRSEALCYYFRLEDQVPENHLLRLLEAPLQYSETGRRQWRSIGGVDLKVGGDWAKALYDRAIPNFLNKYAKKWGAKVGETRIASPEGEANIESFVKEPESGRWQVLLKDGKKWGSFASSKEAKQAYDEQFGGSTVHSIDITPAMKKSVLHEGQPIARVEEPTTEYSLG